MAEQDDSSMIGYDPLAWLHESAVEDLKPNPAREHGSVVSETAAGDESVDAAADSDDANPPNLEPAGGTVESDAPIDQDGLAANAPAEELHSPVDYGVAVEIACQIVLEPVQNIQTVGDLHRQLLGMLDNCNKIDIDASSVSQIDTATLQLLLVLKLTAVKQQKEISIDFPSEKFIEASDLLGLSEMLSVDQAASGFF